MTEPRSLGRRAVMVAAAAWLGWSAAAFVVYWPLFRALPAAYRTAQASPQRQATQARLTRTLTPLILRIRKGAQHG